jgi:hypothetical protein
LPRARGLADLRATLLYNNTLDIWVALCNEKNWSWKNPVAYEKFLEHLRGQDVSLEVSVVCPPIKGFSEKPPRVYNIKLDDETIRKVRSFSI